MSVSSHEGSIQAQWNEGDNLSGHVNNLKAGLNVLESELVLPSDRRWQIGYSRLSIAENQYNAIQAVGEHGGPKSTFGDLVMGNRIDTFGTDTAEDFNGFSTPYSRNADGSSEFIPGRVAEHSDPDVIAFHLSEVGDLRNQAPIGALYENGAQINYGNGDVRPVDSGAFYLTRNFPKSGQVFPLNKKLKSRNPFEIAVGDATEDMAMRIGSRVVSFAKAPLIPKYAVRREISEQLRLALPDDIEPDTDISRIQRHRVGVIKKLNDDGLVDKISLSDARPGQAIEHASRAYLFDAMARGVEKVPDISKGETRKLDILTAARVSALVLPSIAVLNHIADSNFRANIGRMPTPLEKAAGIRSLVAEAAFELAFTDLSKRVYEDAATSTVSIDEKLAGIEAAKKANIEAHTYFDVRTLDLGHGETKPTIADAFKDHGEK